MESKYLIERRQRMLGLGAPEEKKRFKPIPKKSAKMKVNDRELAKIVKEMLAEDDRCAMKVLGVCSGKAVTVQHMKRRGSNMLNKKYLKRSCSPCNLWAESNPVEALAMGIAVSVHKIETV